MARVKRSVNAQKKRREVLERALDLVRDVSCDLVTVPYYFRIPSAHYLSVWTAIISSSRFSRFGLLIETIS